MRVGPARHSHWYAAAAGCLVVGFANVLHTDFANGFIHKDVTDVCEAAAAALAAVLSLWRARRVSGRARWSWLLFALALASRCVGESASAAVGFVTGHETSFPSAIDLAHVFFGILVFAALLVRPPPPAALNDPAGNGVRLRTAIDGSIVVSSLFILGVSTGLIGVWRTNPTHDRSFWIALSYPVCDLLLLTVALLATIRARMPVGLTLLTVGLLSISFADGTFAHQTATDAYQTGAQTDIGWLTGMVLFGLAALYERASRASERTRFESRLPLALPYLLVVAALLAGGAVSGEHGPPPIILVPQAISLICLVIRLMITVFDNRRLTLNAIVDHEKLQFRAFHDALTGLANREMFHDRLGHAIELHHRDRRPVSVLFIDLDDFKAINDSYGHDAGDALLIAVAARLSDTVRTGDTVARLGGDEFAVLVEDDGDLSVLAERILTVLRQPVATPQRDLPVRASIGMTTVHAEDDRADIDELLKRADVAMYAAKRRGKGAAVAYYPGLQTHCGNDLDQRMSLTRDIDSGAVRTVFQPIVRADGSLYGHRALARWRYNGEDFAPEDFIALADRAGVLTELNMLMLRNTLSSRVAAGSTGLVSVHIGLGLVRDRRVPRRLAVVLAEFGVSAVDVMIEIAETEALNDGETLAALHELRELGLRLAIDDFGVGYSNLSRLDTIRPDVVKLDQSFTSPLKTPGASTRLVAGVTALAHDLGALVIAEGIETEEQFAVAAELGCDAMQGPLFGRPSSQLPGLDAGNGVRATDVTATARAG